MRPINIYQFTRLSNEEGEEASIDDYYACLSGRSSDAAIRDHEYDSLKLFVARAMFYGCRELDFEGFAFSYQIPQIGKEFDLLKVFDDLVLNIELKSGIVPQEKVLKQMKRNNYYLGFIGKRVAIFTFCADSNSLFFYNNGAIEEADWSKLVSIMHRRQSFYAGQYDALFRVSSYLVSPTIQVDSYLHGNYFLTPQQEEIKRKVLQNVIDLPMKKYSLNLITGSAGTGKTLLLYDLARELGSEAAPARILHCAYLLDGHEAINEKQRSIQITPVKRSQQIDYSKCGCVIVDEGHRIYPHQLEAIVKKCTENALPLIVGLDSAQFLSQSEERREIEVLLREKYSAVEMPPLTEKIRTNKKLARFIKVLWDKRKKCPTDDFSNVELAYANDYQEARRMIDVFRARGYEYISLTPSTYNPSILNSLGALGSRNVHHAIGQEYDGVVMVIPATYFSYSDDGVLSGHEHPNPDYLVKQQLFQGLTRARERIALIVLGSESLFAEVMDVALQGV